MNAAYRVGAAGVARQGALISTSPIMVPGRYSCHPPSSLRINFIWRHGIGLRSHTFAMHSKPGAAAVCYLKELGELGLEEIPLEHDGLC